MNKEIEEMQKVICENCSYKNIENYPCKKERNKCASYQIAGLFYNAGYRNPFTGDFAIDTQKAYKEGYIKGIEETEAEIERLKADNEMKSVFEIEKRNAVKDFAEYLKEYARSCKASGYDGIGENDIDEKLKEYMK